MTATLVGAALAAIGLAGVAAMQGPKPRGVDPLIPDGYVLVHESDFSDGTLGLWEPRETSEWNVEQTDGEHVLTIVTIGTQGRIRSPFSYVTLPEPVAADLVLTFIGRCFTDPSTKGRDLCAFVGWTDPEHYTYVHFAAMSDSLHNAVLRVDGADRAPLELLEEPKAKMVDKEEHLIKVERDMTTGIIRGYVDDMSEPCLVARDPDPRSGRVGVGSFDDKGSFDDVKLYVKREAAQ